MRKIINGKVYDTETAAMVCDISGVGGNVGRSDFKWEDTSLYRSPKGQFFVAGEGGAMTRWARSLGDNGRTGGSGVELIGEDEAMQLVEEFGSEAIYREFFGEPEEG